MNELTSPAGDIDAGAGGPARFVIAGGPGSGKSTLMRALSASGEICYAEISRQLIREQHACGGRLLPWGDLRAFALECAARMLDELRSSSPRSRCFFDRGLPDLIGYLRHGDQTAPPSWRQASHAYARTVFFAPPWREIFIQDPERPQTFAEACALGAHIRQAYLDCGFTIIELVLSSVADRVAQVRRHVDQLSPP
jgi:predicted ATPase